MSSSTTMMATETVATFYTSSSSTPTQETASSTSSSFSSSSSSKFIGSKPSTVLFFLALCIGIAIAFMFIFFTFRYLVRSRFGMYMASPPSYGGPFDFGGSNRGVFAPYLMNDSLTYAMGLAQGDNLGNPHRYRVARRKKLTQDELDEMFPATKYSVWLSGGEEQVKGSENLSARKISETDDSENEISAKEAPEMNVSETVGTSEVRKSGDGNEISEEGLASDVLNEKSIESEQKLKKPWPRYTSGDCTICLDTFTDDSEIRGLSCGHAFHVECIDPWLTGKKACCPTCKHDFLEDSENGREAVNPDFRDFDSLFEVDQNDNSNIAMYRKPTEFKANTLLCAMLLSRIGRYHTDGPVDLDGLEDEERVDMEEDGVSSERIESDGGDSADAVTRPERAVTNEGNDGENETREHQEHQEHAETSSNHDVELQSMQTHLSDYLDAESTLSDMFYQARDASISPTGPPLPDIHHINRHICQILENHPFNVADLGRLDELAQESADRMFRWYTLPFWRAMGIQKLDMYYYFVVWFYQKKKNQRVTMASNGGANENSAGSGVAAHGGEDRTQRTRVVSTTRSFSGRLYNSAYNILDTVRQRREDRHRERRRRHRARERSRREAVENMV